MYRHILARDLKRKKTMNLIILLFVILAAAFVASSLNIISSVTTSLDVYFEKAELTDFFVITTSDGTNDKVITDYLSDNQLIDSYFTEEGYYFSSEDIVVNGKESEGNITMICCIDNMHQKLFNMNNKSVTSISDGGMMTANTMLDNLGVESGDSITLKTGDDEIILKVEGAVKDALTGSAMMGINRVYVSSNTYETIKASLVSAGKADMMHGNFYGINTQDTKTLKRELGEIGIATIFMDDISIIRWTYIFDMVIPGILLVVSIVLILIAMVVLRFTITFTLEEEYREIGIMKAIGIKNGAIRALYLIKYFAIAVVGSLIGLIAGFPFGNLFLAPVERNMVMDNSAVRVWINLVSVIAVVAIIMLFCIGCTRKVRKFSPIDAIRCGNSGERYKKKSVLRLTKSHIGVIPFMATNDILSGIRRFIIMIIVFTLGTLLMIIPLNSVNTLSGKGAMDLLGVSSKFDLEMDSTTFAMELMKMSRAESDTAFAEMTDKINENGIPASLNTELFFNVTVKHGETGEELKALQGTNRSMEDYIYLEGTAPRETNEIAMTNIVAKALGVVVGDTVKISMSGIEPDDFVVTAIYQSMNNLGREIRFDVNYRSISYEKCIGCFGTQISFTDNPSYQTILERRDKLAELFPDFKFETLEEAVESQFSSTIKPMSTVGMIIVIVVILIDMMVAVLMMKSFIIREKGEIATLKSIGFKTRSLVLWQVMRIGIVMVISVLIGALISEPLTRLSSGQVFAMMGASNVQFDIKPLEVFVAYPLIILAATLFAAAIAALGIKKIAPQDAGSIE